MRRTALRTAAAPPPSALACGFSTYSPEKSGFCSAAISHSDSLRHRRRPLSEVNAPSENSEKDQSGRGHNDLPRVSQQHCRSGKQRAQKCAAYSNQRSVENRSADTGRTVADLSAEKQ